MDKITKEDYTRITNCSEASLGRHFPRIPFEDVMDFLNKKGYEVIIHRGEYKDMPFVKYEDSGTNVYGKADIMTEVILAVKPGTNLPSVVSSDECKEMYLWSVFERELVKKLLF